MKKLTVGLAVLLSGYAANSLAALPTGASSRCDVSVPSYCGGFTFGLTGLYWRPSVSHLDYALTYPSGVTPVGAFAAPTNGTYHSVGEQYDWGFSANIGYIFPCSGNDVTLKYTHWDHEHDDSIGNNFGFALPTTTFVNIPGITDIPFTALTLTADVTLTGTISAIEGAVDVAAFTAVVPAGTVFDIFVSPDDITGIAAHADFSNHTWDLTFGQSINIGCNGRLHWYGGLRYSRLEHNLNVTHDAFIDDEVAFAAPFTTVVGLVGTITVGAVTLAGITAALTITPAIDVTAAVRDITSQKSDFNGVGPEFGIDASYHLGGGFGIVGGLSASLLVGEVDSSFTESVASSGSATFDLDDTLVTGVVLAPALIGTPLPFGTVLTATPAVIPPFDPADLTFTSTLSYSHPSETRVVPNIDAKIGVDWTYQFCNCSRSKVTIEAGYMVSHYFNAVDRLSAVGAIAPEARTRQTIDLSFDGPYVGVQVAL